MRGRKLTAILYLNEGWEEWEGGQLRVHVPTSSSINSGIGRQIAGSSSSSSSSSSSLGSSGNAGTSSGGVTFTSSVPAPPPRLIGQDLKGVSLTVNSSADPYIDIDPMLGRMVVFRRCLRMCDFSC